MSKAKPNKPNKSKKPGNRGPEREVSELRVIGGRLRGSKLRYEIFQQGDDPITRPMKHRVREAIFNLISTDLEGRHAIDLFAGTGALGIEALSRGALTATFIERHVPTAKVIEENLSALSVAERAEVLVTSAFLWGKREFQGRGDGGKGKGEIILPWLVFCSPPYSFYQERQAEMLELVVGILEHAPPESILVIEADKAFDFALLPGNIAEKRREPGWLIRTYPPAVVGIWRT